MSIVTAKAFRQQIMKPAEGLFLFHARAIERLIEGQLGEHLAGVSIPDLPYYLMPKADFLYGLETENAEALSVIEGLKLPDLVILLPSPAEQRLEQPSFTRLRHDYWARAFEAEVARAWHMARADNQDGAVFGSAGLTALIGRHAFAEVREVLARDGIMLPVWDDDTICRSFVAMVARLRWFAPGARGFYFPAIRVWPDVDRWLTASGMDLPAPLSGDRLPLLLVRSRPGSGGELTPEIPLLPGGLPYGRSDPDLPPALALMQRTPAVTTVPAAGTGARAADADVPVEAGRAATPAPAANAGTGSESAGFPAPAAGSDIDERLCSALRRGTVLRRRRGWLARIGDKARCLGRRLLGELLFQPGLEAKPLSATGRRREYWRDLGLALFEQRIAVAQRAELGGRFARALRQLVRARRLALRLIRRLDPASRGLSPALEAAIADWEAACEAHMADLLAARWKLDPRTADEMRVLIARLAADDRARYGSPPAQMLLANLEQALLETRGDYYRLRTGRWLLSLGRGRIREVLPFQGLLKSLRALESACNRLEELLWPLPDLERFGAALAALTRRIGDRLDAQIGPRVEQAMREADFVPRNHREIVAAHKMKRELLDVIKHRRHLKFTDVRDIVARNILRLPDPTLGEFFRGDRLSRFDRTAARALPGVYRPGEFYIKGLQQLGAPLFGTGPGRLILRHLLLPFGGALIVVKSLDLLLGLIPHWQAPIHFTNLTVVMVIGSLINLFLYTGIGRHVAVSMGKGSWRMLRFVTWDGPRALLRWGPVARLLGTGFMRGMGRNLVAPLLIGILPLAPIIALAVFVEEVPIKPGLWLFGLAFALGTLARNTPAGRRFLDNLTTSTAVYLRRINQALFIGLIQQLLYFFKEVTRRFSQVLHRVDEMLTHYLGERWTSLAAKAVLTPVWRLSEALIQFYVTVLVEPQVNPVKHFPIVTVGHKLLLPFLPAITAAFIDISHSVLPKVIAYPLVTLTILLLPGLFGFLVWELKENWKLYQANHRRSLGAVDDIGADDAEDDIEPAVVGSHGETMRGMMVRGFHSGTLPRGFDKLRRVINDEQREQMAYPKRLRRCQRNLDEVETAVCVFVDLEFSFALRERCRDPSCTLTRVETNTPRLATNLVELRVAIHPRAGGRRAPPSAPADPEPVLLGIRISLAGSRLAFETELAGDPTRLGRRCWALISEDLRLFAGRAGVDTHGLDLTLPGAARRRSAPEQLLAPGAAVGRWRRAGTTLPADPALG